MAPGHRLPSAACVLLLLALARAGSSDVEGRRLWLELVALPLGYGHLVGGWWLARGRVRPHAFPGISPGLFRALLWVTVLNLLAAYSWALQSPALAALVLVPMLVVSLWHIVENDFALATSARTGRPPGAPCDGAWRLGATAAVALSLAAAALVTPEGGAQAERWLGQPLPALPLAADAPAPLGLDELVTAVLMYHAASWFLHSWPRASRSKRARDARRRLVLLHAVPLGLNAALYLLAPTVHDWVAAPWLFLFWSVLHAAHTAWARVARASPRAVDGVTGEGAEPRPT